MSRARAVATPRHLRDLVDSHPGVGVVMMDGAPVKVWVTRGYTAFGADHVYVRRLVNAEKDAVGDYGWGELEIWPGATPLLRKEAS